MIKNGKYISPPGLNELFALSKSDILNMLRVAMPGTIDSYDSANNTATVIPGYNIVYNDGTTSPIAKLQDCPVFTLQGGGLYFKMPIKAGDECLVLFADACIDQWFQLGGQQTPLVNRKHSLSDGIVLVGINSLKGLAEWSTPRSIGSTEGGIADIGMPPLLSAKIAIDALVGLVTIRSRTKSLFTVLNELTTAVSNLNSPTDPNNVLGIVKQLTHSILALTTALSIDSSLDPSTKAIAVTQAAVMTDIETNKIPALQTSATAAAGNVTTDIAQLLY